MSDIDADKKAKRDRSPGFPFIPLKTAVERLATFEEYFKRHPAPSDKAGLAWGMAPKGSQALQTIAALKAFGFLEATRGKDAELTVTEEGRVYLRTKQDEVKRDTLKRAALKPKQIEVHWLTWGADRPRDPICLDTLVLKEGFSQDGAAKFLKVYDETIDFARLSDSDKHEIDKDSAQPPEKEEQDAIMQPQAHHEPALRGPQSPSPYPAAIAAGLESTPAHTSAVAQIAVYETKSGARLSINADVDLKGAKVLLKKLNARIALMEEEAEEIEAKAQSHD